MLVLDRSGSMCSNNGATAVQPCYKSNANSPCSAMITAAKIFTGAFAEGRDQIGLLTFSDGYYLESKPTTNFQTLLGYSNSSGSGIGMIDTTSCNGGTGTAEAISMAYNELYKIAEPGAMNIIMLETDGLPNALVYNFYASTPATGALNTTSNCQNANNPTYKNGGWKTVVSARHWTPGIPMNTNGTAYMDNVPAGSIGGFYTSGPAQGSSITVLFNPSQTRDTAPITALTSHGLLRFQLASEPRCLRKSNGPLQRV